MHASAAQKQPIKLNTITAGIARRIEQAQACNMLNLAIGRTYTNVSNAKQVICNVYLTKSPASAYVAHQQFITLKPFKTKHLQIAFQRLWACRTQKAQERGEKKCPILPSLSLF